MITVTVSCDICNTPVYFDAWGDEVALRQVIFNAGWRKFRDGWDHVCPQCMFEARRESDADRFHYLAKKRKEHFRD